MEPINRTSIIEFLNRLGEKFPPSGAFYLLGGSALCLLGNLRETLDIDYTTDLDPIKEKEVDKVIHLLASQLKLDVESVPIGEFIPLPPRAMSRRRFAGHYGNMDVYIFDLYSISLSKVARGFDADIEDVLFLLRRKLVSFQTLEKYFQLSLQDAPRLDISREEFSAYFEELRRRWLLIH